MIRGSRVINGVTRRSKTKISPNLLLFSLVLFPKHGTVERRLSGRQFNRIVELTKSIKDYTSPAFSTEKKTHENVFTFKTCLWLRCGLALENEMVSPFLLPTIILVIFYFSATQIYI